MKVCGAPMEAEADDEVKKYLDHAINKHNASSNEENIVLVEITKVLKQVVAGMKYTVDLLAEGETSKKRFSCQAVLVSQPWINPDPEVVKFTITPAD